MNQKLKDLYLKSGLTQTDFATYIGTSQPKLNDLLHGRTNLCELKYNRLESLYRANVIVADILYQTECHMVVEPKLSVFYIIISGLEFEMHIYKPKYIGIGKIDYEYLEVKKVYSDNGQIEYDTSLINKLLNDGK